MSPLSFSAINPKVALVISRALAALRPSLIAFLVTNAMLLSGGTQTPISFCNVLFVGNLCAALTVGTWFGWRPIWQDWQSLDRKIKVGLFFNGCLAALLSSLIFVGLAYTSVTNAVLLGRLGPVIYALVGTLILGRKIQRFEWIGFSLIIAGVLAIVLKTSNFQINRGDLLILLSAVVYAASSTLGKLMLSKQTNLRTVVFSRNFISSIIFFIIANVVFGPEHFADVLAGQLWIVMVVYALIIIVLAQFLWYAALEQLSSNTVGKWTALSPVFGVTYAFLLNGERPSMAQVLAFLVIMAGITVTGFNRQSSRPMETNEMADGAENCMSTS